MFTSKGRTIWTNLLYYFGCRHCLLSFLVYQTFFYKLPSVLFAILGIYSVYRFSSLWYSKEKAILAALILASCQALFLITNDVRTDTNLLGLVMFSIWQLYAYINKNKWKHLFLSSIGIGAAMMAKGPIALIILTAALGSDFILKRQWRNIFKPQWIVLLIIILIILIPMSYGLYTQFDLHPEKTAYGLKGPSGLRFFYWTQSFGRITGENYWENDAGYFYFLYTILWDFQPWIILFIPALILKIRKMLVQKFKCNESEEYSTLGGFVLVFIALSLSKYKLPHYIFVLFPFASIILADFIYQLKGILQSRIAKIQFGFMHLFWLAMIINFIFFFPPKNFILPAILTVLFATNWLVFSNFKGTVERIFLPTLITAISFNLLLSLNFYPNLLKYQSTSQIGKLVSENEIPVDMFYHYNRSSYSLDFYAKRITPGTNINYIKCLKHGSLIYIDEKGLAELEENNIAFNQVGVFPSFEVTALELPFLYNKTRNKCLKNDYLIEIK